MKGMKRITNIGDDHVVIRRRSFRTMAERLGRGEAAIAGAAGDLDQGIPRLVEGHLAAQDAGDVEVDVLAHGPRGARVGRELDHGNDGVADDVALARGKQVDHEAGSGLQRHTLGGG